MVNGATSFMAYLPKCEGGKTTVTLKLPTQQNNIQLNIVEIRGASSLDSISPNQLNVQGSNNGNNGPNSVGGFFLTTNTAGQLPMLLFWDVLVKIFRML
jgi:hypothetical protein